LLVVNPATAACDASVVSAVYGDTTWTMPLAGQTACWPADPTHLVQSSIYTHLHATTFPNKIKRIDSTCSCTMLTKVHDTTIVQDTKISNKIMGIGRQQQECRLTAPT